MRVIIEGPNNVGKSTIIKELKKLQWFENSNVEYFGMNTPKTLNFYNDILNDYDDVICDRFMISELVYSEYYKRDSKITIDDVIKTLNNKKDVIMIFVDAQYEFIVNSYKNKQEEFDYDLVRYERLKFDEYRKLIDSKCQECKMIHIVNSVGDSVPIAHIINKIILQRRW